MEAIMEEKSIKKDKLKSDNDSRKITVKNYVILLIAFVICLFAVFGIRKLYLDYENYRKNVAVISGEISELHEDEIDAYITENEDVVLYFGVSDDDNCRALEEEMKKVLDERHLKEEMIYVNLKEVDDIDTFYKNFNESYPSNSEVKGYPTFVVIRSGKVLKVLSNSDKKITVDDFELLLDEFEIGD